MKTYNREPFEYKPYSSRLKGYDYTQPGAYFLTICTHARMFLFGEIRSGTMDLNEYGEIAHACWLDIPNHFSSVAPAPFVIMPNHVHGIILIKEQPLVETQHAVSGGGAGTKPGAVPDRGRSAGQAFQRPPPASLPAIVRSYKSAVTKLLNEQSANLPATVWQRNYYEHVIRNQRELNAVIEYINFNPAKWDMDSDNPVNIKL